MNKVFDAIDLKDQIRALKSVKIQLENKRQSFEAENDALEEKLSSLLKETKLLGIDNEIR
jgi:hypothetical protein